MVLAQVKAIKPKKMRIDQVRLELLNALRKEGKEVKALYEQTTSTWKGDKPKFESLIGLTRNDATVVTGPTGSDKAVNKFRWLDEGTSKRWAVMSSNWSSKTKPGSLKSSSGSGRVVVVGKRRMKQPRPGIKARKWTEQIHKQRRKKFTQRMIKAKNKGMRKIYG